VLSWKSHGGPFAIEINWQCEVAIAECESGNTGIPLGSPRPPMEYCWNVGYNVDKSGYTTKSITGHIMIAQTRRSVTDRTLADHADRLRETIEPKCPSGFMPVTRSFNLSEDKCRLDFAFSFEQMAPNIPPRRVVQVNASHSLETPNLAMHVWNGTISATYELARGAPRRDAALMFLDLLKSRIGEIRQKAAVPRVTGWGWVDDLISGATADNVVIPTRFTMSEKIYERESATFSLSYMTTLNQASLPKTIEILGIFNPVPGSDWESWYESLRGKNQPFDPRGVAGLRFDPQDDRLIDLCLNLDSGQPLGPGEANQNDPGNAGGVGGVLNGPNVFREINVFGGELQPAQSWLDIRNGMRVEQVDNNVEQRLLPVAEIRDNEITQMGVNEPGGGMWLGPRDAPTSVVQRRGKGMIAVILEGRAARAGYAISPPELNAIGGVQTIPANREGREFFRSEVATSSIYPICVATWRLRWLLPAVPKVPLTTLENPLFGKVFAGSSSPPLTIKGFKG